MEEKGGRRCTLARFRYHSKRELWGPNWRREEDERRLEDEMKNTEPTRLEKKNRRIDRRKLGKVDGKCNVEMCAVAGR